TPLETALDLLGRGLWPVPITATDDTREHVLSPGKQPIEREWGRVRHTPETLRAVFGNYPFSAGVGIKLGPVGGVVDIEIEDRGAGTATLLELFGGEIPNTLGWDSTRGYHYLFLWDDRFKRYGKAIIKGADLPGVELRIGWSAEDKQYQSVCPPSPG